MPIRMQQLETIPSRAWTDYSQSWVWFYQARVLREVSVEINPVSDEAVVSAKKVQLNVRKSENEGERIAVRLCQGLWATSLVESPTAIDLEFRGLC